MKIINILLPVLTIIPLVIAMINSQIARLNRLSWNSDNLNQINFILLVISLIPALIMLFLNKEKKIWVLIFSCLFILVDIVLLLLGYTISNFGF